MAPITVPPTFSGTPIHDLRRQPAATGDDLGRFGLEDEIADGEDQPVGIDDHAATAAFGAEELSGARIGWDGCFDPDDGGEEVVDDLRADTARRRDEHRSQQDAEYQPRQAVGRCLLPSRSVHW